MIYVIQKALRRPAAEKIAMQLVKKIINANKSSRFLMISSDSRSPKSLRFYFDFSFPENLTAIYMKNISDIDISHYKEIFFFVRTDRSDFLKSSYGFENFDTQILKQSFPKLYKSSGVYLFHVVKPFNQYSLKKLYSKFGKGN